MEKKRGRPKGRKDRVKRKKYPRYNEDRDKDIRTLRKHGATLEVIGEQYGISRERVRQIAGDIEEIQCTCKGCGKVFTARGRTREYCTVKCFSRHHLFACTCKWCGKTYYSTSYRGNNCYCSKRCRKLARIALRPDIPRRDQYIREERKKGRTLTDIAEEAGVSIGTVQRALNGDKYRRSGRSERCLNCGKPLNYKSGWKYCNRECHHQHLARRNEIIKDLFQKGFDQEEIARMTHLKQSSVSRILKEQGVTVPRKKRRGRKSG